MRVRLGLVTETTAAFLNQVKLCLYSLRKNGGALKSTPVTLITNARALPEHEVRFFDKHFSPIEFKVAPRLGAIRHTSKLNVLYSIDPQSYDVLLYLDCDTVVRRPLDCIVDPINREGAQFVCRRGGETDRNRFVDFNALVTGFCRPRSAGKGKILFEEAEEWPMFNTGVFLATSEAVRKIRSDAIDFTYSLFDHWQRTDATESRFPYRKRMLNFLYRKEVLDRLHRHALLKRVSRRVSRQQVVEPWTMEQGALALACIKAGVKVRYLDDVYNSWGPDDDFRVLHCFKSAYGFSRAEMYTEASERWIGEYARSQLPGKVFLASIVSEFKQKANTG
jgi:hypothetical protein